MLSQTAKVILSSALSVLAIVLFLRKPGALRRACMLGMLLSTVGDFFMTDFFGLGGVSTYPGAAAFIAAHVVYAVGFIRAGRQAGYRFRNRAFAPAVVLVAAAAVLLGCLAFTVPEEPQTVMFCLILVYLAVIGFNLVSQFVYACASPSRARKLLYLGMTLFLISDFTVFLPMLNIRPEMNDFVWATYLPAQLIIILFNT